MRTLEQVRAKIIEAVPEKGTEWVENGRTIYREKALPLGLADVLRAMERQDTYYIGVNMDGTFEYAFKPKEERSVMFKTGCVWNLSLPLDEQKPEVIKFLGKVLGV